jgi:hypothetical protein
MAFAFVYKFRQHARLVLMLAAGAALTQPALAQRKKKQPETLLGRLHMADGSTQLAQLWLADSDILKSTGPNGVEKTHSPDEVSSFVMGTDSFTVLRDFYVTLVRDAEHYNSSFVRVCAAGAGLELYEFRGSMARSQPSGGSLGVAAASSALRAVSGVTPLVMVGAGQGPGREKIVMTTAWLLRRDGNPRWLTLPSGARNLREVIEPIVADDKELVVRWPIQPKDVPLLLSQYVDHKTANAKP